MFNGGQKELKAAHMHAKLARLRGYEGYHPERHHTSYKSINT